MGKSPCAQSHSESHSKPNRTDPNRTETQFRPLLVDLEFKGIKTCNKTCTKRLHTKDEKKRKMEWGVVPQRQRRERAERIGRRREREKKKKKKKKRRKTQGEEGRWPCRTMIRNFAFNHTKMTFFFLKILIVSSLARSGSPNWCHSSLSCAGAHDSGFVGRASSMLLLGRARFASRGGGPK